VLLSSLKNPSAELHKGIYLTNTLEEYPYKTRQEKAKKSEWHNSKKIASWEKFRTTHVRLNQHH
jgi:hypothetical protein